jgi:hypothetical protein
MVTKIEERAEQQRRLFYTLSTRIDTYQSEQHSLPLPFQDAELQQQQQQQQQDEQPDDAFSRQVTCHASELFRRRLSVQSKHF